MKPSYYKNLNRYTKVVGSGFIEVHFMSTCIKITKGSNAFIASDAPRYDVESTKAEFDEAFFRAIEYLNSESFNLK